MPAGNLTGTINASHLPDTVVTTGNDATHGFNTLLGNSVSTAVSNQISNAGLITEDGLKTAITNSNVVGGCSASSAGAETATVTCTDGSLANAILEALLPAINAAASGQTVTRSGGSGGGGFGGVN